MARRPAQTLRIGALALVAAVLTLTGPVAAATKDENRAAAELDTANMLQVVPLPPDATAADGEPVGDGGALEAPPSQPGTPNLVVHTRFYRSATRLNDVVSFLDAHVPAGSKPRLSGSAETRDGHGYRFRGFEWPAAFNRLGIRWLLVSVSALDDGTTGIRVDAMAVFIDPRPAGELVPTTARDLTITMHGRRAVRITHAASVERIARLLNHVQIVQPGIRSCPRIRPTDPEPRLVFRARRGGPALAVADVHPTGCTYAAMRIGAHTMPALDLGTGTGPRLLKALGRLGVL